MPTVRPARLEEWIRDVVEARGATTEIARIVSESLVSADLRGHSSHGVRLLPRYLERIVTDRAEESTNTIDPTARPRVEARAGPRVQVDGNGAYGRVVGNDATEIAIRTTEEHGIAAVGIRDGNHLGRMGEWAEMAAGAGLVTLLFVKAEAKLVAPFGTADRRLSTNPIAAGVPTFGALEFPLVLDMATSAAAGGKVWERHRGGEDLPEGWAILDDGSSMENPDRFVEGEGALRPLGGATAGHKGFGLSVVAELLGALVGNGVVAGEREHVHFNNSVALFSLDPTWFTPTEVIRERILTFSEYVRESSPVSEVSAGAAAGDGVLLPGEAEHRSEQVNRESGLDLPEETVVDLNRCGEEVGVGPLDDVE